MGLDKGIVDGDGLRAGRAGSAHHILGVLPIVEGKDQGAHVGVGPHGGVGLHVVQVQLVALAPKRLHGQVARLRVRPGERPGSLAGPQQHLAAGLPLHVRQGAGQHCVGVVGIHRVPVREVGPQLGRDAGHPPAQGGGETAGRDVLPLGDQPHDVHQVPLHGDPVVAGGPAPGGLVVDPHGLVLVAVVRQPDPDGHRDPLPLLDGLEDTCLAPGLKPPVQVVHPQCACAVGQRQRGKVGLLDHVELRDHVPGPRLVQARDDLRHPHPPARQGPLGHRQPDAVRVLDGEPVKGPAHRRVARHRLGVVGGAALDHLHGVRVRHALKIQLWEIDGERLEDGDIGKIELHPGRRGERPVVPAEHISHEALLPVALVAVREDPERAVQEPAVAFQRGVPGPQLRLLVVELIRL